MVGLKVVEFVEVEPKKNLELEAEEEVAVRVAMEIKRESVGSGGRFLEPNCSCKMEVEGVA